jgi:hypothetical protein
MARPKTDDAKNSMRGIGFYLLLYGGILGLWAAVAFLGKL